MQKGSPATANLQVNSILAPAVDGDHAEENEDEED